MNITEIRVKLVGTNSERLRAFCSVTLDGAFVVRDLKVIDGANGPFVAMPSRKLADHCGKCGSKNHLRARFCNECGQRLDPSRAPRDPEGRIKLHADVAHPIHSAGREEIQRKVIEAYQEELARSGDPDYEPTSLDFDDAEPSDYDDLINELKESASRKGGNHEGRAPIAPSYRDQQPTASRDSVREKVPAGAGKGGSQIGNRQDSPSDAFSAGIF